MNALQRLADLLEAGSATAQRTAEQGKDKLGSLAETLEDLATDLRRDARRNGGRLTDRLSSRFGDLRDSVGSAASKTQDRLGSLVDDGSEFLADNPTRTLLIGGAVGFLIGFGMGLMRSSQRDSDYDDEA